MSPPRRAAVLPTLAASLVILLPCFWQPRIQAGDLSSHLYNAWLAELIQQGRAPGLALVPQKTNILFDWMLSTLLPALGPSAAQRLAVALAVLIFFWGAFAFVSRAANRIAWDILPLIAVLTYGWVFHMGFFNFYISLGLSFAALALCWQANWRHSALALPLLALAYLAHALPVVWAAGLIAYLYAAHWLPVRYLLPSALAAMILLSALVHARMPTRWFPLQILSATGIDQVWVFDPKYVPLMAGLLLVWGLPILSLLRTPPTPTRVALHFCALTAFATLVFPSSVLIPGYKHTLAYIADRMSLPLAICLCALAASASARPLHRYLRAILALVYFAFLFHDHRALNAFEGRLEQIAAALPSGQRVINNISAPALRVNPVGHMIDRICAGRCYSYANYEPSTAQFRVRAVGNSPLVVSTYKDSWALQTGAYVVREQDLPLHALTLDAAAASRNSSPLSAGETPAMRPVNPLRALQAR